MTSKQTRKFNGKTYEFETIEIAKSVAKERVAKIRKYGYAARFTEHVTDFPRAGTHIYKIWVRKLVR